MYAEYKTDGPYKGFNGIYEVIDFNGHIVTIVTNEKDPRNKLLQENMKMIPYDDLDLEF